MKTVTIIGRMNVGKSTLFNRLIEHRKAITSSLPGTTRSPNRGVCRWRGRDLLFVDTGGLDMHGRDELERNVRQQARRAIEAADLIILLVDGTTQPLPDDRALARDLRKGKKPVLLAVNKTETAQRRRDAARFATLGLGKPMAISALQGTGTGDLLDAITARLPEDDEEPTVAPTQAIRIAILGRPNVGKSSLANALLGREEALVSPVPHTTRDIFDAEVMRGGRSLILVDTAGIRRRHPRRGSERRARGQRELLDAIEFEGVQRSVAALRRADVALLVLAADEPFASQDRRLAREIVDARRACIIVVNKSDLAERPRALAMDTRLKREIYAAFPQLAWAPIRFVSAMQLWGIEDLFTTIEAVFAAWSREMPIAAQNAVLRDVLAELPKPATREKARKVAITDFRHVGIRPPKFSVTMRTMKVPPPRALLDLLEKRLRSTEDFEGTPIIIRLA